MTNWDIKCIYPVLGNCVLFGSLHNEPNTKGFDRIVGTFGTKVVGEDGYIDRKILGSIVFSDSSIFNEWFKRMR